MMCVVVLIVELMRSFEPPFGCVVARSCGTPDDIAHGWHAGECYTYGCRVSYHCAEGFELVGRKERLCQPDGQWNPHELPSCVRKLQTSIPLERFTIVQNIQDNTIQYN